MVDRDTGEVKRVYYHNRRYYVAARTGDRYGLRIENDTDGRVLVVLAVDGVNVISGQTADFNQRGYILSPHQSADINGFRKSETEIAAFRFAPAHQSYAARTGRPFDVGVIGMAVFRERVPPPPPPPPPMSMAAPKASSAEVAHDSAAQRGERLGTAHGEIEHDVSRVAPFEKVTARPESVRLLEYDSTENLIASGVIPRRPVPYRPRPFPGHRANDGYVPDPPE